MNTPEFEIHRAIVHSSNVFTGAAKVRLPSLLGAGQTVDIPTTGLTKYAAEMGDEWNVPAAGSSVFVAVSVDRTQFLWVTALSTPTNGPTTFNGGIVAGGAITANGGIDAQDYVRVLSDYDAPRISLTREGEGTAWIKKETGYVSINALSDDETTVQYILLDGNVTVSGNETIGGDLGVSGDLTVDGNVLFKNNALVASTATTPAEDGTNVDHIWHNDSSNGGHPGTWNFVSDSTYKAAGNSMLAAGGLTTTGNVAVGGALIHNAQWAGCEGPSSHSSTTTYSNVYTTYYGSGSFMTATANGIQINRSGRYYVWASQRANSTTSAYIAIGESGNRTTLENRTTGIWGHDHSQAPNQWSVSHYIGYLAAGELVTCGHSGTGNSSLLVYSTSGWAGVLTAHYLGD